MGSKTDGQVRHYTRHVGDGGNLKLIREVGGCPALATVLAGCIVFKRNRSELSYCLRGDQIPNLSEVERLLLSWNWGIGLRPFLSSV